ncbi:acyclic terpene utilization AtuA family protein [Actinomycetospora cinnamomea]|uniref:acyclic terpene utilization AtuA family protein n=1 Tax=Actinomycetospora cinnamomea TaxID=663609 RepID=UPI001FAEC8F6|nr:acyclic terpene utilization AtuA family protein [Actinomycetospora cinnamomea]
MTGPEVTPGGTPTLRLGAGAGYAGDRVDPAVDLARRGRLDHLVFECLGERTIAAAHARRAGSADATAGIDPLWARRVRAVLAPCRAAGTRIVSNAGAADPPAAADVTRAVARELGLAGVRVAAVTGDDVLAAVRRADPVVWETGRKLSEHPETLVAANAYLGAEPIVTALAEGADVVVTGRVADPALYLGPLVHAFGWSLTGDPGLLGRGTAVGHLLECAGQLTGGYFADPVTKPVPRLAELGFPYADVAPDGSAVLGKLAGTGGLLDVATATEQLLYEVGDPSAYVTPDVVADFSSVHLEQDGPDRVRVGGASGSERPGSLKVTLGFREGWEGEGQISYAGPRALERARLAADVVVSRLDRVHGIGADDVHVEYVGAGAAFRGLAGPGEPLEVRVRVVARTPDPETAEAVGWEVESLYTNGPAGGGGARRGAREVVAVRSCLLDRRDVRPEVSVREA